MSILSYIAFLIAKLLQAMIRANNFFNGISDGILTSLEKLFNGGQQQ